jgi:hypothetical protein
MNELEAVSHWAPWLLEKKENASKLADPEVN